MKKFLAVTLLLSVSLQAADADRAATKDSALLIPGNKIVEYQPHTFSNLENPSIRTVWENGKRVEIETLSNGMEIRLAIEDLGDLESHSSTTILIQGVGKKDIFCCSRLVQALCCCFSGQE